jgi:hypothetical protein
MGDWMAITDTTNIEVTSSEKNLTGDLIDVYTHGLKQKALLRKLMPQYSDPSSNAIYTVFVNGANGDSSLYEDLAIIFDITSYALERDHKHKTQNPDCVNLLNDIPIFIEAITDNALPCTTTTVKTGIKHFDNWIKQIKIKGLIDLK